MLRGCYHVLVVEDDPVIQQLVSWVLQGATYQTTAVSSAEAAGEVLAVHSVDLIVLDLGLPGRDGLSFLRDLRSRSQTMVLVLSAKIAVDEKVRALQAGADDYLTKPFDPNEFLARVQALLRRLSREPTSADGFLKIGDLELNPLSGLVRFADGRCQPMTPTECRLLHCLARNPGRIVTRDILRSQVWGYDVGTSNDVDVYIRRIRQKIEPDPARPRYILTRRGVGYTFKASDGERLLPTGH